MTHNKKVIIHILRCAIEHNGKVYYDKCMRDLNLTGKSNRAEDLNIELRKFGSLHYEYSTSKQHNAWEYFEINDYGRKYVEQFEYKGISKIIRQVVSFMLTLIQFVALTEGWISYLLGSITASLFTPLSYFSLLWYPIDVLFRYMWMLCDCLKLNLWSKYFTWKDSYKRWNNYFPDF